MRFVGPDYFLFRGDVFEVVFPAHPQKGNKYFVMWGQGNAYEILQLVEGATPEQMVLEGGVQVHKRIGRVGLSLGDLVMKHGDPDQRKAELVSALTAMPEYVIQAGNRNLDLIEFTPGNKPMVSYRTGLMFSGEGVVPSDTMEYAQFNSGIDGGGDRVIAQVNLQKSSVLGANWRRKHRKWERVLKGLHVHGWQQQINNGVQIDVYNPEGSEQRGIARFDSLEQAYERVQEVLAAIGREYRVDIRIQ